MNQAAYYQATFGDRTDDNGIQLSENVVDYIKTLNTPLVRYACTVSLL